MNSRWVYKLENKFGNKYIPNLMSIVVLGMAIVFVSSLMMPSVNLYNLFYLDRTLLFKGQIWRLVTFIFLPSSSNPFYAILSMYVYFMMGRMLEQLWGSWRFNFYYLTGMLVTVISALIFGYAFNTYINLSLFLAVATLMPDTTFMLFFILPIKAKWLGIGYALMLLWDVVTVFVESSPLAGVKALGQVVLSLGHYLIFFGPTLYRDIKEMLRVRKNRKNWKNNNRF